MEEPPPDARVAGDARQPLTARRIVLLCSVRCGGAILAETGRNAKKAKRPEPLEPDAGNAAEGSKLLSHAVFSHAWLFHSNVILSEAEGSLITSLTYLLP